MGRLISDRCPDPFLFEANILASSQSSGNSPEDQDRLKVYVRTRASSLLDSFSTRGDMSPGGDTEHSTGDVDSHRSLQATWSACAFH